MTARPPFLDERVFQNIVDDENLPTEIGQAFCDEARELANESEVIDKFSQYSWDNRLMGIATYYPAPGERLGHLKTMEALSSYMSRQLSSFLPDEDAFEEGRISERFRAAATPGTSLDKREALMWFQDEVFSRLPDYTVSGRPSWVFRDALSNDAINLLFHEHNYMLPCRLGLPEPKLWGDPPFHYARNIEFVGFAFHFDNVETAKKPTAFDGGYESVRDIWLIGGITQPLPHAPDEVKVGGGLPELVCEPLRLVDGFGNMVAFRN